MNRTAAAERETVFAANRAIGKVALTVGAAGRPTHRTRVHEAGSLRVRFPNATRQLEAVLVNTAGGMTGGDRFDIGIDVEAGARLTVTSAAAEKIYRSLGPDTQIDVKLRVAPGGTLAWLPQESILFDSARVARSIDIDISSDASLLLAESMVFGRTAMGEAMENGRFVDRWRVRRDGKLVFAETLRLDGAIAAKLADPAVAAGGVAVATVLMMPAGEAEVAAVRALGDVFQSEVGASAWNGFAVIRLLAKDGATLRRDLTHVLTALKAPLPRLWLN